MLPRQEDLETAIGQTKRAAVKYGDTPTGRELHEIAIRLARLREPEVAAYLERRRLRRVSSDRAAA